MTKLDDLHVPHLRFVDASIFEINKIRGNVKTLPKYFLSKGKKQRGMSNGDSGGSFQINIGNPVRSYLHGIRSFGTACFPRSCHSSTNVL
uniref:Uncharacterized protein n=1 Tax=Panagrolaimus sp. ES5 TaxID=591445 RepID=A0AC34GCW1_9BILA